MKIVNVLVLLLFASILITSTSCQKELDFGTFESTGSLKTDSAFDCLPSSVHGTYMVNNVLTDTNYIEIQVNTTLSGNYLIQSDTTNGYGFMGEGAFTGTGTNVVRLYASGTPIIPGTNSFIIHYNTPAGDSSFCIIDVDVIADAGANAEYTFAGAGGTCTGGGHGGVYAASVPMSLSNTDTITVDVTVLGNYSITTGTINGVTFLASGAFTTLGVQTVVLTANGTPAAQGLFDFPVSGNSPGCAFNISFDPAPPPAVFTLGGTPGNCTGVVLNGTYQANTPVTSSNTATIDVTVTTVGLYTISTNLSNGISFTATGIFTLTGPQSVTLTATGIPTAPGSFNFIVTVSSSTCTFSVPFTAAATDFITCDIDGIFSTFNAGAAAILDMSGGSPILTISGETVLGSDPSISLRITSSAASIPAGTYTTGQLAAGIYLTSNNYDVAGTDFFAESTAANQSANPPVFTIVINTITATRVTGTFNGTGGDNDGAGPNYKVITNGVFDVPLQ